ncbi:hypothetical protein LINPERHAP2_LOCUS31722, partial [Linum perenne]
TLPLRNLTHKPIPVLRVGHHRRSRPLPLGVRHNRRLPSFHSRHRGIRRAQVNPDHLLTRNPQWAVAPPPLGAAAVP